MIKENLYVLLVFFFFSSVTAQDRNPVKSFELAREKAYSQQYEEAIVILHNLKEEHPENNDYTIFLARVLSWKQAYPAAIELLEPLTKDASLPEALKLMITIQTWAGNFSEVKDYSKIGLADHPKDRFFTLNQTLALVELEEYAEAEKKLDALQQEVGSNAELEYLRTRIYQRKKQEILFSYTYTKLNEPESAHWEQAYISYKKDLFSVPVVGRFTYGEIQQRQGFQLEVDAYPRISDKSYLYLSVGKAIENNVFAEYRSGLEYYYGLNNGISLSLGTKYLHFTNNEVLLYTGSISVPLSEKMLFTYRPFFSNVGDFTHTIAGKLSTNRKEGFLQIDLQYGTVPYEYFISDSFTELKTARAGIRYQVRIFGHLLVQPIILLEYEEYLPQNYRYRYTGQLLTTIRW